MHDKNELISFIAQGNPVKYVFFWGHQPPKSGISHTCFSQWYLAPFELDGITYPTAEHYMMAEKARLFGDQEILSKILAATHPGEAKKLGRQVRNFDNTMWDNNRFEIVVQANLAKFGQALELKEYLLNTKKRVLVEASPRDKIWGIGLAASHPDCEHPSHWPGLNLLGFALMEVRDRLSQFASNR